MLTSDFPQVTGQTMIWGDGSDGWLREQFETYGIPGFHPRGTSYSIQCHGN